MRSVALFALAIALTTAYVALAASPAGVENLGILNVKNDPKSTTYTFGDLSDNKLFSGIIHKDGKIEFSKFDLNGKPTFEAELTPTKAGHLKVKITQRASDGSHQVSESVIKNISGVARAFPLLKDGRYRLDSRFNTTTQKLEVVAKDTTSGRAAATLDLDLLTGAQVTGVATVEDTAAKTKTVTTVILSPATKTATIKAEQFKAGKSTGSKVYTIAPGSMTERYYAKDGKLKLEKEWDDQGNVTRQREFADDGHVTSDQTFGADGKPLPAEKK